MAERRSTARADLPVVDEVAGDERADEAVPDGAVPDEGPEPVDEAAEDEAADEEPQAADDEATEGEPEPVDEAAEAEAADGEPEVAEDQAVESEPEPFDEVEVDAAVDEVAEPVDEAAEPEPVDEAAEPEAVAEATEDEAAPVAEEVEPAEPTDGDGSVDGPYSPVVEPPEPGHEPGVWLPTPWDGSAGTDAVEPEPASDEPVAQPDPEPVGGAVPVAGDAPAATEPPVAEEPPAADAEPAAAEEPAAADPEPAAEEHPAAEPAHPAEPAAQPPAPRRRRRWPRVVGGVAATAIVLAGAYIGALWLLADRVPTGTVVAGVEIGGLDADAAVARLEQGLAAATTDPIPVSAGESRTELDPAAAGLTLDASATVDQVTGFGLEPARLWRQVFGAGATPPVTEVDDAALAAALDQVAADLDTEPVDGTVAFDAGAVVTTASAQGLGVDRDAARATLVDGWLTAPRPLALPTVVLEPAIGQAEVDAAVTGLARPVAEGPVVVEVGGQRAELPVTVLTDAASFVPSGDALELTMDGDLLSEAVLARTTDLLTPAADATFAFENDAPVVVPGTPGTTIDPQTLADAVGAAALADGDARTTSVELVPTDPSQTDADLAELGIVQVVSEFSTPLTSEPIRTINITNGASKLNGMLIRPGETFSLGDALGPLDAAHGYVQAGAIINGEHTEAWGGGLSQMSTTTYNAAFFAGMELVEHHPHSEWFRRYPEGRESTIFTPQIDMKWRNNTPYGALLQSWVDTAQNRVYVRIWSTPYWTVETTTSGRWGVVAPKTVYSQSATCEPQSAGNPGFSVKVTRTVSLDGAVQSNEEWVTTYKPQNQIVCGSPPAASP